MKERLSLLPPGFLCVELKYQYFSGFMSVLEHKMTIYPLVIVEAYNYKQTCVLCQTKRPMFG